MGATGRTGRQIVLRALAQGHALTALVRDPANLGELGTRVDAVRGDVRDPAAVHRAVRGADAVLVALGRSRGSPRDLQSQALANLVSSMTREGVRRLVVLANSAVEDPTDRPSLAQRAVRVLLRLVHPTDRRDALVAARTIERSGLAWTIVRASVLRDTPPTKAYRVGRMTGDLGLRVSRSDVAEFMLMCATEGAHLQERPYIGEGTPRNRSPGRGGVTSRRT